jgi:hypothetical protein
MTSPESPGHDVDGRGRVLLDGVAHLRLDVGELRVQPDPDDGEPLARVTGKPA